MFNKVVLLLIVLLSVTVEAIITLPAPAPIDPVTAKYTTRIQRVSRKYQATSSAYSYIRLYPVRNREARTFNGEILLSQQLEFGSPDTPDEIDNKLKLRGMMPSTGYTITYL